MKLIRTTMLALLMATATIAQAKNAGRDEPAPTEQEELAIAALEGLMAQPAERSMPILKKVMAGPQSPIVKRRALFVLSQVGSAEAREIVMQTARSGNPELRGEAIRSIGISGDPKSLDALQEVYKAGTPELKEDVLQAWMIAGRKDSVYQAALAAKTEDEASAAIRTLGVMGAKEELRKLAERPDTPDGLVDALAISGDLAGLRKIADGNGPIAAARGRGAEYRHHQFRRRARRAARDLRQQCELGDQGSRAARHADRTGREGRARPLPRREVDR